MNSDNNDQPLDLSTPIRRGFLDHKLKSVVVKFDEKGKPITAGDLGMSKKETLEVMKQAGYKKKVRRLKTKRIKALLSKIDRIKKPIKGYNLNGATTNVGSDEAPRGM